MNTHYYYFIAVLIRRNLKFLFSIGLISAKTQQNSKFIHLLMYESWTPQNTWVWNNIQGCYHVAGTPVVFMPSICRYKNTSTSNGHVHSIVHVLQLSCYTDVSRMVATLRTALRECSRSLFNTKML